eukprot:scaffold264884_cov28-Attheya_sp.AAC.2
MGAPSLPLDVIRRIASFLLFTVKYSTVATCIDHPRSGKTQLFRRNQTMTELELLFSNPRSHTGVGYVQAATNFCNSQQANQIAALCKLWNQLRYMPGGRTEIDEFRNLSAEHKAVLESFHGHSDLRCNKEG